MKIFAVVSFGILLSAVTASARLGETPDQCQMRYGTTNGSRGTYVLYYKDKFDIAVMFRDGKSVEEIFSPNVGGEFTEDLLAGFLSANSEGSTWQTGDTSGHRHYVRLDGRASASFDSKKLSIYARAERKTQTIVPGKEPTSGF